MLNPQQKETLESAFQRGQLVENGTLVKRISNFDALAQNYLARYAVLGMNLDFVGISQFFISDDLFFTDDELIYWLTKCLENKLLRMDDLEGNANPYFICPDEVRQHLLTHLSAEQLKSNHHIASKFHSYKLTLLASELGFSLPEGEKQQEALTGPYGFLDQISHLPQHQAFHQGILNFALNWHEHLFQLGEYIEAGNILNAICFAVARRGERKLAENLLARTALHTNGLINLVARLNLGILLREENKYSQALLIFWRAIPGLIRFRAFIQLAQTLAEMATAYRQKGKVIPSAMTLEFTVILNGWLKNEKSQAIARAQLATTYRYLHMYGPALKVITKGVDYFRSSEDLLNLGRSLLTQGNLYFILGNLELANSCFNEALQIGHQIGDHQAEFRALGNKASISLQLNHLDQAKSLLEEVITLKIHQGDHTVGIEYQNLGVLHEKKNEIALAIGWFQKALNEYEKYTPVDVPRCRKTIAMLEKKLARKEQG